MASTDARPVPRKGVAFRHYFAIRKNDGTLITTWAGQDSEVDKDGAGFNDCTNEATEIGSSGVGYLDLTSTEMNADAVNLKVTVTNTGALPLVVTFFPEEAGDYRADAVMISGDATAADNLEAAADGTGYNLGGGSVVAASVTGSVGSVGSGGITRDSFAANTGLQSARSGTAQAGAASSITLDASASSTTDFYKYDLIVTTGGTGAGQARVCWAYNGTTKVASISPNWATTPDNTTTFAVIPASFPVNFGLLGISGGGQTNSSVAVGGLDTNSITAGALAAIANAVGAFFGSSLVTAATSSTSSAVILQSGASTTDDFYTGSYLVFTSGTLDGQTRNITAYVGSTRTATVSPAFTSAPSNGDTAIILGRGS